MTNLKNILRDVGYCTVGVAAVIVEAGTKTARALVRKGEATLRDNQDTVDDLKRRAKELGEKLKDSFEKPASDEPAVDASKMSAEERAELRRQLDEADAACEADATCETDAACGEYCCEDEEECPAEAPSARPIAPDVIYHAGAPIEAAAPDEEEKTDNGING